MVLYNYIFVGLLLLVAVVFGLAPIVVERIDRPSQTIAGQGRHLRVRREDLSAKPGYAFAFSITFTP